MGLRVCVCVYVLFCLPAPQNCPITAKPDCASEIDDASLSEPKFRRTIFQLDATTCFPVQPPPPSPPFSDTVDLCIWKTSGSMTNGTENFSESELFHRRLLNSSFLVRVTRQLQLRPADQRRLQKVKSLIGFFKGGKVGSGSDSRWVRSWLRLISKGI